MKPLLIIFLALSVSFASADVPFGAATRKRVQRMIPAQGRAKAGATTGWGISPNLNNSYISLSQNQTGATAVIPLSGLKVGDLLVGYSVAGQIESGGNTVTLDANLRKMTTAAADLVDASISSITQLSVTADTAVSAANAGKLDVSETVTVDANYYVLITATTGATCDFGIQGILITVDEI